MPHDTDRFDIFVSYARANNAANWISDFVENLRAEYRALTGGSDLRVFFDKHDIQTGHDWQHRILHGVADSRMFVAFLSPEYLKSEWCRREWGQWIDTEIAKHVFSDGAAPVYVVPVPGFENASEALEQEIASVWEPTHLDHLRRCQFVSVQPFHQEGVRFLLTEDLRKVLASLAKTVQEGAERVRVGAESANTVPPYNRKFTGRLAELVDLRTRLKNNGSGVVCGVQGLGGIGKTELAFTYAHAYANVYPGGRLYVPCEGQPGIRQAALALGDFGPFRAAISDEERKTPDSLFAAVSCCLAHRLESYGPILLVLDNVTHPALMAARETDHLTCHGPGLHLLMTTRLPAPVDAGWVTLGALSEAEAMELMEKHRPFADDAERDAARGLVRRLGGFTMAVELAAAYLMVHAEATYRSLAAVIGLEELEGIAADTDVELRRHQEKRLTAVLGPVLNGLGDAERQVMEMAAFLPPDAVALPWLRALLEGETPEVLVPVGAVADPWAGIWRRLVRLALLSEVGASEPWRVRVHRLVQEVVKGRMSGARLAACGAAVEALVRERDAVLQKTTRWMEARWEVAPLEDLARVWAGAGHERASWLLNQVGQRLRSLAKNTRAEPLMREALRVDRRSFGPDHPDVAIQLNNLAQLLQATNRMVEAEPLMREALLIDRASFGPDHPNVATDLNNLAQLLQATNRMAEAEPLMREALLIDRASFGPDHPDVAIRLNNLAALLQATNRMAEAEPLMREALRIDRASFGPDHPKVATRLNNLAQLLQATNRMAEAEPLMREALRIDRASFGPDHPNVAAQLNNLAQLLKATNRIAEAEPLMREALRIDRAGFGPDHPNVATDLNNLAALLQATNRMAEAEPLMREHLEIFLKFTRATGHEHPHLRAAVGNYFGLLAEMGLPQQDLVGKLVSLGPEVLPILRELMRPA